MLRVLLLVLFCAISNAFFNVQFRLFQPKLYLRTPLCMNYLESLENNSFVPKNILLPKPIPISLQNKTLIKTKKIKPIPVLSFDEMFMLIFNIDKIYMSSNADRIIICYDNEKKVFYMNTNNDKDKIEYLLSLIDVDITIVNDYPTKMDSPYGELYCMQQSINITSDDVETFLNKLITEDDNFSGFEEFE